MSNKSDSKYLTLNNLKGWGSIHKQVTLYYPPDKPNGFNMRLVRPV